MAKGFYLTLMIGPVVPIPVPREVLDALTSVQVITSSGEASGFELNFTLSKRSPLHTIFLLSGGVCIPMIRVVIVVTINGSTDVIMDGIMTHHQVSSDSGGFTLTIKGKDLTAAMDYQDLSGLIPYPAMPAEARVALIVAKYAFLGIVPMVIPRVFIDIPLPIERIPKHQGTDLDYIQQLARDAGYVFYISPGPAPGMSIAYFGPEIRIGVPQPPLNLDMDAHTNVESMSFSFDSNSKSMPIVFILNEATKIPIPIPVPDVSLLKPPLGLIPPIAHSINLLTGTSKLSPLQAASEGLSEAASTDDAVSASGSLDVLRYGRVLKARGLISVRGAGQAFDGLYYVSKVTHNIKRGEYKESFTLVRNGLISIVPRVPA